MNLLLASAAVVTNVLAGVVNPLSGSDRPVIPPDATAAAIVGSCRTMVPSDMEAKGRIVLRSRKGIVQAEYGYVLARKAGATELKVADKAGAELAYSKEGPLLGTDVTWSDITLDYLWWDDFELDPERESESVHGQKCVVVLMRKKGAGGAPGRLVRVWVDRRTGAMLQAEEIVGDKPVRRLWGARIKKFGDRWAPNVLEVETLGSGHRTKITVEELK